MEMYHLPIEIKSKSPVRDAYNELSDELITVARCFAQRTEFGGRENLYASRILHEYEVVYTIRWRKEIKAGMWVQDGGELRKIISLHTEGRNKIIHLKTVDSDAQD